MNPADGEFNLLLPLAFGATLVFIGLIIGFVFWLLVRFNVISAKNKSNLVRVLSAAIFSILIVILLSGSIKAVYHLVQNTFSN